MGFSGHGESLKQTAANGWRAVRRQKMHASGHVPIVASKNQGTVLYLKRLACGAGRRCGEARQWLQRSLWPCAIFRLNRSATSQQKRLENRGFQGVGIFWAKPMQSVYLVPSARLELAQLSPLPPQDSVSTNFTTTAVVLHASRRAGGMPVSKPIADCNRKLHLLDRLARACPMAYWLVGALPGIIEAASRLAAAEAAEAGADAAGAATGRLLSTLLSATLPRLP